MLLYVKLKGLNAKPANGMAVSGRRTQQYGAAAPQQHLKPELLVVPASTTVSPGTLILV